MKSKVVAVYFLSIFLLCSVLTAVNADNSDKEKLYADDNTISDWAKNSVYSMKTHKIMIGVDNDSFSPKTLFSLEQTVVTLVRIYEYK